MPVVTCKTLRSITDVAAAIAIALIFVHAGRTLLVEPVAGVADNGDGWRVMRPAGIAHTAPVDRFRHRFVRPRYTTEPGNMAVHPSSPAVVAALAKHLPFPGVPAGAMDLRQMGATYLLLLALMVLASAAAGVPLPWVAAVAWALSDLRYLLFFNSFYADAAAVAGLAAMVLWVFAYARWRGRVGRRGFVALAVSAVGLALCVGLSSRAHQALPAVLLFIVAVAPPRRALRPAWIALTIGLTVVTLAAPMHFEWGRGHRFPQINRYHTVFRGVAALADDPEAVLDALDIDRRHLGRVGTAYFDGPVPPDLQRALANVSRMDVLRLYFTRPGALDRLRRRVERIMGEGGPLRLGNLPRAAAPQQVTLPTEGGPRQLRSALMPHPALGWVLPLGCLAWLGIAAVRRWPWTGPRLATGLLLAVWATEVTAAVLGDGTFSLRRHLLAATLSMDLLTVLVGGAVGLAALDRVRRWAVPSVSGAAA